MDLLKQMECRRKTPIMGWASWNCFRTDISEERMKEQARALVNTGLAACGYTYLNMDDGFFGGRDEQGVLQFHSKRFPNGIKPVAEYAHELGLKAGIYAEAGDNTCGYYYDREGSNGKNVGLYGYEQQDLYMYLVENKFDYIKVDWCGGLRLGLDEEEQYEKIGKIIREIRLKTNRTIVYNVCRWQFPGSWVVEVADSWRTGADISPSFSSVIHQIDMIKPLAGYCAPGHVNDLDMMQIGNGMTHEEEKSHFAMWCMMSTPLIIGCDLTKITDETLEILKNTELIALNQDSACKQAFVIKEYRNEYGELLGEIWIKELGTNNREKAVAFLNRSEQKLIMELHLEDAGLYGHIVQVRDLWNHTECDCNKTICKEVESHGVAVYRMKSEYGRAVLNKHDKGEHVWKPVQWIDISDVEQLLAEGAMLVDVREEEEYDEKHLPGAINVPYTGIHATAKEKLRDKKQPLILYCATGKRSSQAKQSLEYLGYERIYLLKTYDNR